MEIPAELLLGRARQHGLGEPEEPAGLGLGDKPELGAATLRGQLVVDSELDRPAEGSKS